jgi:HD superfamily phosphohydrolase
MMHMQVYHHHVRIITDNMLLRGIELARAGNCLPEELFDVKKPGFLECYLSYDDERLADRIISGGGDFEKNIFLDLRHRRLFKRAVELDLRSLDSPKRKRLEKLGEDRTARTSLERKIAEAANVEPENVIVHLLTEKNPLCPYQKDDQEILVKTKDGSLKNLSEVIPYQTKYPMSVKFFVLCPARYKEAVETKAGPIIDSY